MTRVCVILVAGLDGRLLNRSLGSKSPGTPGLPVLSQFTHRTPLVPVLPAVTCTMQATMTTGVGPGGHGIIANGLYTHGRKDLQAHLDLSSHADFRTDVSFWEQSNQLLEAPRFWRKGGGGGGGGGDKKVALLFCQNSMDGAADIVLTPKPTHTPDGKTITACWSAPSELYGRLTAELGPFPLQHYWGPMASLPSSQWICRAAELVWKQDRPDLEIVYVPHLDYDLQRLGPDDLRLVEQLATVDAMLAPLVDAVRRDGGQVVIMGDYGMVPVTRAESPNLTLRHAGLLTTRPDAGGKLLVDYDRSAAFAMVDHQIAHVYVSPARREEACRLLAGLPEVERVLSTPTELATAGLSHARTGSLVLLAQADTWFAHDWWYSEGEKPAWQFAVDIHRKPGYDPRELFFDPVRKCIAQDTALVKGSHGLVSTVPDQWPVLLCDRAIAPVGYALPATSAAGYLTALLNR